MNTEDTEMAEQPPEQELESQTPMEFNVKIKRSFGGFKPLHDETFTDLKEATEFVTKHCNGMNLAMMTTFQEKMRDMEFLTLYQKKSNDFMVRTNGKYVDVIPQDQFYDTVKSRLDSILKPLPKIIVVSSEESEKMRDEVAAQNELEIDVVVEGAEGDKE